MKSLATFFADLRAERELTYDDIAAKSGLHRTTSWKIEGGRPIRLETLSKIATLGLGLKKTDADYKQLIALWLREQSILVPDDIANITKTITNAQGKLIKTVQSLPPVAVDRLNIAMRSKAKRAYLLAVANVE